MANYRLRRVAVFTAILGLAGLATLNGQPPPLEWSCEKVTIPYESVDEGAVDNIESFRTITQHGEDGSKEVCKANQEGYDDRVTLISEPINEVTTYTAPVYEPQDFAPPAQEYGGATGVCNDGTETYSVGRGTCSWHGGVSYYY